jgi:hypothetical protein
VQDVISKFRKAKWMQDVADGLPAYRTEMVSNILEIVV